MIDAMINALVALDCSLEREYDYKYNYKVSLLIMYDNDFFMELQAMDFMVWF